MTRMTRRALLGTTALGTVAAVAGCADGPTIGDLAKYAQTAANAAKAALSAIPGTIAVPSVVAAGINEIASLASAVVANPATGTGSPAVQLVTAAESALPMIASFVTGLGPAGAPAAFAISAVNAVLPYIAKLAGITPPVAAAPSSPLAKLPRMTAAEAIAAYGPR